MPPLSCNVSITAVLSIIGASTLAMPAPHAEERGSGYIAYQRQLFAADMAANDAVTYEICGWGVIDLRTPFLIAAIKEGVDVTVWDALAKRFDDAEWERRRLEAVLTAHEENKPMQRTTGLYATGGCTNTVRKRIERKLKGTTTSSITSTEEQCSD